MFFLNSSFMDKGVSYFRGNKIFLTTWFFPGKEACFPAKGSGMFSRLYFLRNSLCIFRTTLSEIRFASFVPAAFCFAKRQGPKYNTQSPFAFVAQLVERSLGKTEVSGSIPDEGS